MVIYITYENENVKLYGTEERRSLILSELNHWTSSSECNLRTSLGLAMGQNPVRISSSFLLRSFP